MLIDEVETFCRANDLLWRPPPGGRVSPHPVALAPLLLPGAALPELRALCAAVFRFHARLPGLLRVGCPGLAELCPLPERTRRWLDLSPPRASPRQLLMRLDVGLDGGGRPRLFETNMIALAGFHFGAMAVRLMREVVLPRLEGVDRAWKDPPDLLALFRRWLTRAAGPRARVGFIEDPPFSAGDTEMPAIARQLRGYGLRTAWGSPLELRRKPRGSSLRGHDVDWVFRDIPFEDLPDPSAREVAALRAMARAGRVIPGPAAEYTHKGLLEAFSSEAFARLFTPSERRLFKRAVPWTRVVSDRRTDGPVGRGVDLLLELRRRRERWILKPNLACGGEGIVSGAEAGLAAWDAALERACREPGGWVVQERVATPERALPLLRWGRLKTAGCRAVYGLFYGGPELFGVYGRVGPGSVVNVARGGALAAVLVV